MAPEVMATVLHGSHSQTPDSEKQRLTYQPAILHNYRRHKVRYADYPAIVPVETGPASSSSSSSVLGCLVSGLQPLDFIRLDLFEGPEYSKRTVKVKLLKLAALPGESPLSEGGGNDSNTVQAVLAAKEAQDTTSDGPAVVQEADEVDALVYVWAAAREGLEESEWDYRAFREEKLARWIR